MYIKILYIYTFFSKQRKTKKINKMYTAVPGGNVIMLISLNPRHDSIHLTHTHITPQCNNMQYNRAQIYEIVSLLKINKIIIWLN